MKIQIINSKNSIQLDKKYIDIMQKYNLQNKEAKLETMIIFSNDDEITNEMNSVETINVSFIEVNSLDFLIELDEKLKSKFEEYNGLTFTTNENGEYCISIIDS